MKWNEQWKADRQSLSELHGTEKLAFIWDYYKIPIVAVLSAVVLAAVAFSTSMGRRNIALYAVLVNTDVYTQQPDTAPWNRLLEEAGIDMDEKDIDLSVELQLGLPGSEMYDGQTVQVLAARFGVSDLDFFAADEPVFQRYAAQDAFVDLSLFLDDALIDASGAGRYTYENADGHTVLGGLVLHGGSLLHESGCYHGDVVIGVAASAQNLEAALALVRQLLAGETG